MNKTFNKNIIWNNYLESINDSDQSDLYDYCHKNTDTMLQILQCFDSSFPSTLSIGPGWIPLVVPLHNKILSLVNEYKIYQIKEKFGALRFYAEPIVFDALSPENKTHVNRIFQHLIQTAEEKSLNTCEHCSAPGKLIVHRYTYLTRCQACFEKYYPSSTNS